MDEKERFVRAVLSGQHTMVECCRVSGISRQTGYKYLRRFEQGGLPGLEEHSRAPRTFPQAMDSKLAEHFIELRRKWPHWGPRKLVAYAAQRHPEWKLPAASTVGALLKRQGLVAPKRRRQRPARFESDLGGYVGPNAMWCADYKGQFRCQDGKLCYPLTLSDGYSRLLLRCQGLRGIDGGWTRKVCESAFLEYGLPDAIRTDNGSPFSSASGLSQLSVWWVRLGIRPVRIQPGRPTQNGRHERIHRTMMDEVLVEGPAKHLKGQQRDFDRFRKDYNQERPHEAIAYKTPQSVYVPSTKRYPAKLKDPEYAAGMKVERIDAQGRLHWAGKTHKVSALIAGLPLGILLADPGIHKVFFGPLLLGHILPKAGFKRGAYKSPHKPQH